MASEKCPKCGGPACFLPRVFHSSKKKQALEPKVLICNRSAIDCRIAELEALLRATEARERELQGKLDEAKKAEIERLKA